MESSCPDDSHEDADSEKDVKRLLSMEEAIEVVELAFAENGLKRAQLSPKVHLPYHKYNGDLRIASSYLKGLDISGVEIVNVHEDNRARSGMPTVMGTVVMIDPKNGAPTAIIGGTYLTDMRTGAIAAVAAKHLARKDSKVVGLVGAGGAS